MNALLLIFVFIFSGSLSAQALKFSCNPQNIKVEMPVCSEESRRIRHIYFEAIALKEAITEIAIEEMPSLADKGPYRIDESVIPDEVERQALPALVKDIRTRVRGERVKTSGSTDQQLISKHLYKRVQARLKAASKNKVMRGVMSVSESRMQEMIMETAEKAAAKYILKNKVRAIMIPSLPLAIILELVGLFKQAQVDPASKMYFLVPETYGVQTPECQYLMFAKHRHIRRDLINRTLEGEDPLERANPKAICSIIESSEDMGRALLRRAEEIETNWQFMLQAMLQKNQDLFDHYSSKKPLALSADKTQVTREQKRLPAAQQ